MAAACQCRTRCVHWGKPFAPHRRTADATHGKSMKQEVASAPRSHWAVCWLRPLCGDAFGKPSLACFTFVLYSQLRSPAPGSIVDPAPWLVSALLAAVVPLCYSTDQDGNGPGRNHPPPGRLGLLVSESLGPGKSIGSPLTHTSGPGGAGWVGGGQNPASGGIQTLHSKTKM